VGREGGRKGEEMSRFSSFFRFSTCLPLHFSIKKKNHKKKKKKKKINNKNTNTSLMTFLNLVIIPSPPNNNNNNNNNNIPNQDQHWLARNDKQPTQKKE
jgi:hypothetical protein